jgi:hypothetical protein
MSDILFVDDGVVCMASFILFLLNYQIAICGNQPHGRRFAAAQLNQIKRSVALINYKLIFVLLLD